MTNPLFLVVNPRSAKGATGRNWRKLEAVLRGILPPFDVAITDRAGQATDLALGAAKDYETVVAVGGDGTINEVANGVLDSGTEAALGILPRGTGSDLVRTLRIPHKWERAAAVLATGHRRRIDVGRATFTDSSGAARSRWFVNAAEVGLGAMVSDAVNQPSRWLPGPAAFMWATLTTMFRHHPAPVSVTTNGQVARTVTLSNAWISNGRYTGGGILSAPRAAVDDALLDVVVLEHAGPLVRLAGLPKLRNGRFVEMRQVEYRQATGASFDSATPQPVEVDGDVVGTTPASFEVVPARLCVVAAG